MTNHWKNNDEEQFIPDDCWERILHFDKYLTLSGLEREIDIAGISNLTSGYKIIRWSHPTHVVIYVNDGQMYFQRGQETSIAKSGDIVFLHAKTNYNYHTNGNCVITWFHLIPDAFAWQSIEPLDFFQRKSAWSEEIHRLLLLLLQEMSAVTIGDTLIKQELAKLLVLYLQRELLPGAEVAEYISKFKMLFNHIAHNLDYPWNVCEMARKVGMSRQYFFPAVKQVYGKSPAAILHEMRMTVAKNFLRSTDFKLEAVAEKIGLKSGFSLSRAFKKTYGVSPKEFRKISKSSANLFALKKSITL